MQRYEERRTENNETASTMSSCSVTKTQSICLSNVKNLYKAFSNLPSFSAFLHTILYHMNYDLPSGNHVNTILF